MTNSYNGCRDSCIGELNGILTLFERYGDSIIRGPTVNLELSEGEEVLRHTFHKDIVINIVIFNEFIVNNT